MQKAYSTFEVKRVDAVQRIVEGIASTPSIDRGGDSMDPAGAQFTLPLPFLWKHTDPIGEVFAADIRPEGIYIKASVSTVDDSAPTRLKERIGEAWASFTAKPPLVRGLSIGWGELESTPIRGTRFKRISKWIWGELSAVVVPMNVEASILRVKEFDVDRPAASGTGRSHVVVHLPGASGSLRTWQTMKTIHEQISAFEATRQAKNARMTELMTTAGDQGVTLDEPQEQEYDGLEREVKSIDAHLVRLNALEEANKKEAVPVNGTDPKKASESRGGVISVKSNLPTGTGFVRYVMAMAAGRGSRFEAYQFAKRWESTTPEVSMVLKAAVDAGTTTDATWAAPLTVYQNMSAEFIELLRPATIIGRIPGLRRVPFNVTMPRQTSGSTVGWVGQAKPKPVGELAFDQVSLGMAKASGIIVIAEELARSSNPSAEAVISQDLRDAITKFLDTQFIDPAVAAVANVSPASVTNGSTVIDSTGVTAAALHADFGSALAVWTAADMKIAGGVILMTETQAIRLSMILNTFGQNQFPGLTAAGGTLFGLPVITSENIPAEGGSPAGNRIVLLKPSEIMMADDGGITIDVSREASVQMNTAPDDPASASTVMVSAFQNNLMLIRAERYINWLKRRTAAAVVIEGALYTG